jgi:hypothetical protein
LFARLGATVSRFVPAHAAKQGWVKIGKTQKTLGNGDFDHDAGDGRMDVDGDVSIVGTSVVYSLISARMA